MLENSEPQAGARPIGTRVWGKNRQASHAPGTRTSRMERVLCRKDSPYLPQAQK